MTEEISILAAFAAGFLSFLSPCVLPVATGHITYITGAIIEEELEDEKLFALKQTLGFVLGFTAVFMIFGLSFGTLGMFMKSHREMLNKASGLFIMAMGLNMIGVFRFRLKGKNIKRPLEIRSWIQSVAVGGAFGIGWTPCIGPILGAILFYAGRQADAFKGAYLLLSYSVGLSIPFLMTALFIGRLSKLWNSIGKHTLILMKLSGILVFLLGAMIFFDKMYIISNLAF